jgi:tRNA (guanosine-2'-O-)-methyltransferase
MASLLDPLDTFTVRNRAYPVEDVLEILEPYITHGRRARVDKVLGERTLSIVPTTEALFDRGNVSAVLRSAEALGYQAVQIMETAEYFREANRVTQGADKWLDIKRWKAVRPCSDFLKQHGYRILATHLKGATPIDEVDWSIPTALVFGNEKEGVSNELLSQADGRVVIPMAGFTQSFNISVAAALALYHIRQARIRQLGFHGDLCETAQRKLRARYYYRSIRGAESILHRALHEQDAKHR